MPRRRQPQPRWRSAEWWPSSAHNLVTYPNDRKIVSLSGDAPGNRYGLLFQALAEIFPVEFRDSEVCGHAAVDARIVLDGNLQSGLAAAVDGLPTLVVMGGKGGPADTIDRT